MDLAGLDCQVDPIIGHEGAIPLGDTTQLKPHGRLPMMTKVPWGGDLPPHGSEFGLPDYTGLFVAGTILPLMMSCLIVFSSDCSEAGTWLEKLWNGDSTTPPFVRSPT